MKTLLLFFLFIFSTNLYSQTQANVKTPNYSTVTAYIMPEWTDNERNDIDAAVQLQYPNVQLQPTYPTEDNPYTSSTHRFNCHGFAWYMASAEGSGLSDPRWIGKDLINEDEHIYWTDGSYNEIPSETYSCKISYDPAVSDHSAIPSGLPGKVLSKWAEGPLVLHDWDDCPYVSGSPDLIYYELDCSREIIDQTVHDNHNFNGCDVQLTNVIISNNVNVNIYFDSWAQINGEFLVPVGSVLNVTP
jgi:hypothetical protein